MSIYHHPRVVYWIRDPLWGALYCVIYLLLRLLPCSAASAMGARLGALEGRLRGTVLRPRVERCLAAVRPDLPATEYASIYREMWRNAGRVHAEMAVVGRLWDAAVLTEVNASALRAVKRTGRPILFVFPHLGNWELLAIAARQEGIALNVVYENLRNRFENRLAQRSRRSLGYRLIPPTRLGVRQIYRALRAREAVALAIDEFRNGNVVAPAFGRSLPETSNLAYALRLARRFDAILMPAYCLRTGPQAFTLTFLDPLERTDVLTLNALCESWIRAHPEQWYMLWRILPDGLMQARE